ncbi:hypothetical protein [Puniceicoccus vermicola]|uniref:Uncharacterized protein n=1 Tax=Puniceicoccus vermicola TaxID=388746 RepID=A0A7X1AZ63_9BACT|nr:hypothetical protein [Puniceicoccus vermicola]MBC2602666.1 hypothetical protein [Puniceicoccus vermicola]
MHILIQSLLGSAMILGVSTIAATSSPYAHLNAQEDGGPAVYGDNTFTLKGDSLVSESLSLRYPVAQQARIYTLGGSVRGAGMLAELQPDADGTVRVVVARQTNISNQENEPYTPIALARLIAPDGSLADYAEFTDQPDSISVRELTAKDAAPGIWRVSFSGGRSNDLIEFRLPETEIWGVRGEMSLGTTDSTPGVSGKAFIWTPPSAFLMMVGIDRGNTRGARILNLRGDTLAEVESDPTRRAGRLIPRPTPTGEVLQLTLPEEFNGVLTVEGVPGLLCPSPEAAARLRGGMVESLGKWVAGPLQARARELAAEIASGLDRDVSFEFPQTIPDDLTNLPYHVLGFGKYGALNTIDFKVKQQNRYLDPMDLNFGSTRDTPREAPSSEEDFRPIGGATNFDPAAFAGAVTFDSPLNPAYHSRELTKRAALGSLVNISNLQGDDLMREGSLLKSVYPITHIFFAYGGSFAEPFLELQPLLDEEVREVWRQGLIALGDKIADYQAYQSNQWSHMLLAHLDTYLATGEKRFLGYFERQARAYYGNTYGPNSKFGIHPTGYYLENYGPDGNYDKLNSFCVAISYYKYRELPDADPELLALIEDAIQRNLRFNSFFWLPQPDGSLAGPNHMNARKSAYIGDLGYPGTLMTKSDFPLSAARFALTPAPERGLGIAGTFSFAANREGWIRQSIENGLEKGADGYDAGGGTWVSGIVKCYTQPKIVEPDRLPYEEDGATWALPGLLAWNQNGIYGMVFSDVAGTKVKNHNSITGGAPSALWTPGTGTFLSSVIPSGDPTSKHQTKPEDLTFAAIYGTTPSGDFFHSGKERASTESNAQNNVHTITSEVKSPKGTLTWRYDYSESPLKIGVRFKAHEPVQECYVNLPLYRNMDSTRIQIASPGGAVFTTDTGCVRINWAAGKPGELATSARKEIERLVIPIGSDGEWTWISFKPVSYNEIIRHTLSKK